jgi:hypothetical protein
MSAVDARRLAELSADLPADYAWELLSKDYSGPGDEVAEDMAADERRAIVWALLAINANLARIAEELRVLDCSGESVVHHLHERARSNSREPGRREVTRIDKRRAS